MDKYEITVGIECHVQLATKSKLFSTADNDARDKDPNSVISPIDYALPGMMPVLNKEAVNLAVKAAKALNADVAPESRFDRKHYFYPDLPKGYQISQMYQPIILGGHVAVPLEDGTSVMVRIHHAHLEEDAGKLTHHGEYSLVDLNRAGTPLIEIVSLPDIHSAAAAKAYAAELHKLMMYAGVTNGDLYHGNMRFDVNISIAEVGSKELGTRTEVKNLNSFRSVERAVEYEAKRHAELLERGESVVQETRGWDDAKQKTTSQRSKEEAQDYRYMPDPDIPPIVLESSYIEEIQASMPMLPSQYREKWESLKLDGSVVEALLAEQTFAEIATSVQELSGNEAAKRTAHWLSSAFPAGDQKPDISGIDKNPEKYSQLAQMVEKNEVNSTAAKQIFSEMLTSDKTPLDIAKEHNLLQISDEGAIIAVVEQVIADPASQKALDDIRAGNDKAIGFLVGQVMKLSKGKANPSLAQKLIRERL